MSQLQTELFQQSEELVRSKDESDNDLKVKLAAAFKDNAVLVQRLKSITEERDSTRSQLEEAVTTIESLEADLSSARKDVETEMMEVRSCEAKSWEYITCVFLSPWSRCRSVLDASGSQ